MIRVGKPHQSVVRFSSCESQEQWYKIATQVSSVFQKAQPILWGRFPLTQLYIWIFIKSYQSTVYGNSFIP